MYNTDWNEVTRVFNGIISEGGKVEVKVSSEPLGESLVVEIPEVSITEFMKHLVLYKARVTAIDHE